MPGNCFSPLEVWITDPESSSIWYEPTWHVGVVSKNYTTIRVFPLYNNTNIVNATFKYSDDGIDWNLIGVDENGGFEGFIVDGGGDNRKMGNHSLNDLFRNLIVPCFQLPGR